MERPFAMTTNATEREIERLTAEHKRLEVAFHKATDAHDEATSAAQEASREQSQTYDEIYEKLNGPALLRREAEAGARVNAASERLRNTKPSTLRGVMLKMKSTWLPRDREALRGALQRGPRRC